MSQPRCQVCGRIKATRKDGMIVAHYRRGDLCAGAGRSPYAEACDAIRDALAHWSKLGEADTAAYLEHRRERRNEAFPVWRLERAAWAFGEAARLRRRLENWSRDQQAA